MAQVCVPLLVKVYKCLSVTQISVNRSISLVSQSHHSESLAKQGEIVLFKFQKLIGNSVKAKDSLIQIAKTHPVINKTVNTCIVVNTLLQKDK